MIRHRFNLRRIVLPLGAIVACLISPLAKAGTIVGVGAVAGPGLGFVSVPVVLTPDEGVDSGDVGNISVPIKRFDHTGYIDIEFFVRGSDPAGTTEYLFYESVDNNTGIDWDSYVMQLGFGLGAGFTVSPAGDGLDFDAPDYAPPPTSSAFASVITSEDMLTFLDGTQSTGSEIYQVRIDVPDGIESFTLRQYPVPVPEPAALALAAGGLVGLLLLGRRKRA